MFFLSYSLSDRFTYSSFSYHKPVFKVLSSLCIVRITVFAETFKIPYMSLTASCAWLVWAQCFCTVPVCRQWIQINILFMFEQLFFSSMNSPFALFVCCSYGKPSLMIYASHTHSRPFSFLMKLFLSSLKLNWHMENHYHYCTVALNGH